MQTPAINQRRQRSPSRIIQPATFQRKPFRAQVSHRRRERKLPIEPRFNIMLVRRNHVQAASHQRPYVRREKLVRYALLLISRVNKKWRDPQSRQDQCRSDSAPSSPARPAGAPIEMLGPSNGNRHPVPQTRRRVVIMQFTANGFPQALDHLSLRRARGTHLDMRIHCGALNRIRFPVHSSMQQSPHLITSHGRPLKHSARRARARDSLDITVPGGTPVISAISRYDNSSISRSTIASRKSGGSCATQFSKTPARSR
jgi:hypothetical protein